MYLRNLCNRLREDIETLFARRISGDPHALDFDTEAGRWFIDALRIIAEENELLSSLLICRKTG